MLYHNYLERVLGSRVKVMVLRALFRFPGKKFTVRELAAFVGASHTPILRLLSDLRGINIITTEKHGTAHLVSVNKDSYLYIPLQQLFLVEKKTKERLISTIRSFLPSVKMAILFGSIQGGNEDMDSDIDLLIVTEHKNRMKAVLDHNRHTIARIFGNIPSAVILTEKEFKHKANKPFAVDILKGYTLIKGKDLVHRYWKK